MEDPAIYVGLDALRFLGMTDVEAQDFMGFVSGTLGAHPHVRIVENELPNEISHLPVRMFLMFPYEFRPNIVEFGFPHRKQASFGRAVEALLPALSNYPWASEKAEAEAEGADILLFRWEEEDSTWKSGHVIVTPGATEILITGAVALWFLGKLADAYVSRLADRLADSTIDAARRIRFRTDRLRGRDAARGNLVRIEVPGDTTTLLLPERMTDDAREAFIDLDPTADGIRGETLRWDPHKNAWVPIGAARKPATRKPRLHD